MKYLEVSVKFVFYWVNYVLYMFAYLLKVCFQAKYESNGFKTLRKSIKRGFPANYVCRIYGYPPIAETYQTFGYEIDRYTIDQAVANGLTVLIKYHPHITKVLLYNKKSKRNRRLLQTICQWNCDFVKTTFTKINNFKSSDKMQVALLKIFSFNLFENTSISQLS